MPPLHPTHRDTASIYTEPFVCKIHVADAYFSRCSETFYILLFHSCVMAVYTFLDFGDDMPLSVARLASALDEKKESRTRATRGEVRMVKTKNKIDDMIKAAKNADAAWLKIFVEKMGQARLKNKVDDMIQEGQNAEAVWRKKCWGKMRQARQERLVATQTRLAHLCGMDISV